MAEETKTYVELLYPGSLFAEDEQVVVKERNAEKVAKKYRQCFAFRFYDLTTAEVSVDGVRRVVSGERKNVSPLYYPGAKSYTLAEVKRLPDSRILASNMECNGWKRVVKTRRGNFQPLNKTDVIL